MSSSHAAGDPLRSLELNNRGNIAICSLIFPIVAFIWMNAPPLVELLYTADYLEAVPIVRVYSLSMVLMSVELATVLMIYEQGRFVARVSGGILIGAAILSYLGAVRFGLIGVAAGSMIGTLLNRLINFNRAAKVLGVPFSQVQDWPTLARLLGAAAGAGVAAGYLTDYLAPAAGLIVTLTVAAALTGVAYLLLARLLRVDWIFHCLLGRKPWPVRSVGRA